MPMTDKTVQVVIEIPEEVYKSIRDNEYCGIIDSDMYNAIANGTQLPKGHGQLVDMDAVLRRIEEPLTKLEFMVRMSAEKVLEADKEGAE